jgi:hypothetical protein
MAKRKRNSEGEYIPPDDSKEVWKSTSKWREYQMEILKLRVIEGSLREIVNEILSIQDGSLENILLPQVTVSNGEAPPALPEFQERFYNKIAQVLDFSDEPPTDLIISELLDSLHFCQNNLRFRPRPHLEIEWKNRGISSEADFGIYSKVNGMAEYMMVVEAKRRAARPERQLCGEMLVASYNRFSRTAKDQEVFGMMVMGSEVRFYKATFSEKYLTSLSRDKSPEEQIDVLSYPFRSHRPLSLTTYEGRREIAVILLSIRKNIIEIIENE